jgi:hypothetical protein
VGTSDGDGGGAGNSVDVDEGARFSLRRRPRVVGGLLPAEVDAAVVIVVLSIVFVLLFVFVADGRLAFPSTALK